MHVRFALLGLGLGLLASPLMATQSAGSSDATAVVDGDSIVIPVAVYGSDACPKSEGELVVCAHHPESERYRVPAAVREQRTGVGDTAWAVQVEGMEDDARYLIPGSCTAVGPSGSTGCTQQMLRQWFRERRSSNPD